MKTEILLVNGGRPRKTTGVDTSFKWIPKDIVTKNVSAIFISELEG
jgi:hypothetical protein